MIEVFYVLILQSRPREGYMINTRVRKGTDWLLLNLNQHYYTFDGQKGEWVTQASPNF